MPDSSEIVVTGQRIKDNFDSSPFWRAWMDNGFGTYETYPNGGGGSGATTPVPIDQVATSPVNDYKIPKKGDLPEVQLKGFTKEQFETFMKAYDNINHDSGLADTLKQMARDGIPLKLGVAATLPPQANGDARATITFMQLSGDVYGNNEIVMPGTEVEIVVKASAIRNDGTWEDTFAGIIAHEFTHLKKDSNGRFLEDHYGDGYTGTKTTDVDDSTFGNLYSKNANASYSNSSEVTATTDDFGFYNFIGTDGNNHINMLGSTAFAAYSGGGNDFIIGSHDTNVFYVDGPGKKVIVEGGGYDMIQLDTIEHISDVVLTYVGSDLYITSTGSAYLPIDDPNAVIIINQGSSDNSVKVESVSTHDFFSIDLYNFWSQSAQAEGPVSDGGAHFAMLEEQSVLYQEAHAPNVIGDNLWLV